jgi:hypothetical protein
MRATWLMLAAAGSLSACGGEGPQRPENAMTVTIQAPENAVYELRCGYRAIDLPGQGMSNRTDLSGTGPKSAFVPTNNARCTLKQTAGAGPVTATIEAPNGPVTATVAGPGATASLDVL